MTTVFSAIRFREAFVVSLLGAVATFSSCGTQGTTPPSELAIPALLPVVSATKKLEVQRALGVLLNKSIDSHKKVLIADDVLTKTSLLTLERKKLIGRELGIPEQKIFQLLLDNGKCYLHYNNAGTYELLNNTECLPE